MLNCVRKKQLCVDTASQFRGAVMDDGKDERGREAEEGLVMFKQPLLT